MLQTRNRSALVTYGALIGLSYLGLATAEALTGDSATPGPLIVALILLALCMGLGGVTLVGYSRARRRRRASAAPLRSLGVAASLATLFGVPLVALAMMPQPLPGLAVPLFAFQIALTFSTLWLQTFPITSPTARRIVQTLLQAPALLSPAALFVLLGGDPLQPWLVAMSAGWLLVLLAKPKLQHQSLDGRVPPPALPMGHAGSAA